MIAGTLHPTVKQYWSISGLHRKQLDIQFLSLVQKNLPSCNHFHKYSNIKLKSVRQENLNWNWNCKKKELIMD